MLQVFKALALAAGGALIMLGLMRYPHITFEEPDIRWLGLGMILIVLGRPRFVNLGDNFYASVEQRVAIGQILSSPEHDRMIKEFLSENQKMDAIKYYRDISGLGLRDSKEYVDYIEQKMMEEHRYGF
jgi:hypothetical protein